MPRLKYNPANISTGVNPGSAPRSLKAEQAPDVMKWLEYENAPLRALNSVGRTLGRMADRAFDIHMYDLEKREREEDLNERILIEEAQLEYANWVKGQKRFLRDESNLAAIRKAASDAGMETDEYVADLLDRRGKEKRADIIAQDKYSAVYKDDNNFKRRLQVGLRKAGDSAEAIVEWHQNKHFEKQQKDYDTILLKAKTDIRERAHQMGLLVTWMAHKSSPAGREVVMNFLTGTIKEVYDKYKGSVQPERLEDFKARLEASFVDDKGRIKAANLEAQISEQDKNVNRAKDKARVYFLNEIRKRNVESLLEGADDPEKAAKGMQEIASTIDQVALEAAKEFGVDELPNVIKDIKAHLNKTYVVSNAEPAAIRNAINEQRKNEAENDAQRARELDTTKIDSMRRLNEEIAPIVAKFKNDEITAAEARAELTTVAEAVFSMSRLRGDELTEVEQQWQNRLEVELRKKASDAASKLQVSEASNVKEAIARVLNNLKTDAGRELGERIAKVRKRFVANEIGAEAARKELNKLAEDVIGEYSKKVPKGSDLAKADLEYNEKLKSDLRLAASEVADLLEVKQVSRDKSFEREKKQAEEDLRIDTARVLAELDKEMAVELDSRNTQADTAFIKEISSIETDGSLTLAEKKDLIKSKALEIAERYKVVKPFDLAGEGLDPGLFTDLEKSFNRKLPDRMALKAEKRIAGIKREEVAKIEKDKSTIESLEKTQRLQTVESAAVEMATKMHGFEMLVRREPAGWSNDEIASHVLAMKEEVKGKYNPTMATEIDDSERDLNLDHMLSARLDKVRLSPEAELQFFIQNNDIARKVRAAANSVVEDVEAEARKQLESSDSVPDVAKYLEDYAEKRKEQEEEKWKDSEYQVVASSLLETHQYRHQLDQIIGHAVDGVNKKNMQSNVAEAEKTIGNIITNRQFDAGVETRELDDHLNLLENYKESRDPAAKAIAHEVYALLKSGDIDDIQAGKMMDRNLAMLDEVDVYKGLSDPATFKETLKQLKGKGFPTIQGAKRARLQQDAERLIDNSAGQKDFNIRRLNENHFHKLLRNEHSDHSLDDLSAMGVDRDKIDALKGEELYVNLLADMRFGTSDGNIDKKYEPETRLQYKSRTALAHIVSDLESDAWHKNVEWEDLGIMHKELINLKGLAQHFHYLKNDIDQIQRTRLDDRGQISSEKYNELHGASLALEAMNENELEFSKAYPETYQALDPARMDFMMAEQVQSGFATNRNQTWTLRQVDFDRMNEEWRSMTDPRQRAAYLHMIESKTGEYAGRTLETLHENTDIKYEMQFYADLSGDALKDFHGSVMQTVGVLENTAFPKDSSDRKTAEDDFNSLMDTDIVLNGYLNNYPLIDERISRKESIKKMALFKMSKREVELTAEDAIAGAMDDLVHQQVALIPSGPNTKTMFQFPRSKANALLQFDPERLSELLNDQLVAMNKKGTLHKSASLIVDEDEMAFWVNTPDNKGVIAMGVFTREASPIGIDDPYERSTMNPLLDKKGQRIIRTWDQLNKMFTDAIEADKAWEKRLEKSREEYMRELREYVLPGQERQARDHERQEG